VSSLTPLGDRGGEFQEEVGIGRGGRRSFREFVQGRPVRPLGPEHVDAPATRGDIQDCAHELRAMVALLDELVQVDSGEMISVPKRLVLNAANPFEVFLVDAPDEFHALKVDNPTAVALDVLFSGGQPTAGNSDERVPAHMGRVLTRPFDEVAIGFDPAVVPGGNTVIRCTFYSRAFSPTSYAFI
jgi:hypothetical protein